MTTTIELAVLGFLVVLIAVLWTVDVVGLYRLVG